MNYPYFLGRRYKNSTMDSLW